MNRVTVLAVTTLLAALPAQAQQYPNKPIRIVVPYAAGGTSDILARQIGPKLTETWNQPVVIENRAGANGNVGAEFVAKSAPDGYTLLLTDLGGLVISASVYPKLPFNPSKDFSPVVMVSYSPHVLAVHPDVQVKNVQEPVAMATARITEAQLSISAWAASRSSRASSSRSAPKSTGLHSIQGRLGRGDGRGGRPGAGCSTACSPPGLGHGGRLKGWRSPRAKESLGEGHATVAEPGLPGSRRLLQGRVGAADDEENGSGDAELIKVLNRRT